MQTNPTPAAPTTTTKTRTIKGLLEGDAFQSAIAKTLPKHLKPERFVKVAILAMQRTPKLSQCTEASFFNCLLQLSALGLEPDGRLAHLIPFENRRTGTVECTLIVDWKGLKELVLRTGIISFVHADVVHEGDLIDYNAGELKTHVPWFLRRDSDKPAEEGPVFAAYAIARMKDGTSQCSVMSSAEIDGIRARSRSKDSGPWVTDLSEMQKKTAFRRLTKWLPMSPEIRDAVETGDDIIDIPHKQLTQPDSVPLVFTPAEALPEPSEPFVQPCVGLKEPEEIKLKPEPKPEPKPEKPKTERKAVATTPEPAEPVSAPEPAADQTTVNHLKFIAGMLPLAGATEVTLLGFLRETGMVDESLGSLEEIRLIRPAVLENVVKIWDQIVPHIKVKGGAK